MPDGQSGTLGGGPTTNKRTVKTAVVVRDGETIVLGGLQKDSQSETVEKIPVLGDIPIFGRLFQSKARQHVRQELLIVLTPYIIRGPEDLRRIQQRKENERREFLERYTAFKDENVYGYSNGGRRRGLIDEINQSALAVERDAEARRQVARVLRRPPPEGPIDQEGTRAPPPPSPAHDEETAPPDESAHSGSLGTN